MSGVGDGFWVRSLAETHPAGGRILRHQHRWGQLAYAISGVMRIATPTALWLTPPTRAVWIPPGRPHEITMQGATAMRTLYIDPQSAEQGCYVMQSFPHIAQCLMIGLVGHVAWANDGIRLQVSLFYERFQPFNRVICWGYTLVVDEQLDVAGQT